MVKVVLNSQAQDTEPWLWEVAFLMIYFPISSPRRKMTSHVIFETYLIMFEFLAGDSKEWWLST